MDLIILNRKGAKALLEEDKNLTHILSITDPGDLPPEGYISYRAEKLHLSFDDLTNQDEGYVKATDTDIDKIVAMARELKDDSRVLIHCLAGISRSTAAGFIVLCVLYGEGREVEALEKIVEIRRCAYPNRLMIRIADRVLGRKGAMLEAFDSNMDRLLSVYTAASDD